MVRNLIRGMELVLQRLCKHRLAQESTMGLFLQGSLELRVERSEILLMVMVKKPDFPS